MKNENIWPSRPRSPEGSSFRSCKYHPSTQGLCSQCPTTPAGLHISIPDCHTVGNRPSTAAKAGSTAGAQRHGHCCFETQVFSSPGMHTLTVSVLVFTRRPLSTACYIRDPQSHTLQSLKSTALEKEPGKWQKYMLGGLTPESFSFILAVGEKNEFSHPQVPVQVHRLT